MATNKTFKARVTLLLPILGVIFTGAVLFGFLCVLSSTSVSKPKEVTVPNSAVLGSFGETIYQNKVVKYVSEMVDGNLKEFNGNTVTLESSGDTLTFSVNDSTKISVIGIRQSESLDGSTENTLPTISEGKITDLKLGERVSASLVLTADGLLATSLTLFGDIF